MAPAPNEPTPQSPQSGEAPPDEVSADSDRVSPSSGTTPPLPDIEPMTAGSTAEVTSEPEAPGPEAPESKATEPEASAPNLSEPSPEGADATESSLDDSPAAPPETSPVTFEDIAPVAPSAAESEPALDPVPESAAAPARPSASPAPSASPSGRAAATPTASAGTVQRIWSLAQPPLSAAAKTALATGIKGANWLTHKLESAPPAPESSQTGVLGILTGVWRIIKPLLVAVTLSLSRLFNQLLQWSLERLDPEVKAAAAAESSRVAFLITSATLALLFFLGGSAINPSPAAPQPSGDAAPTVVRPAPEQARLDAVQAQLSDVVERYNGTVYAVDLDVIGDRLIVALDNGWYRLSEDQQQRFARQLQRQARDAKFPQLTLVNESNERIARTPVVGDDMVLFQTAAPPPPPEVPDTLDSPGQPPDTGLNDPSGGTAGANAGDSASPAAVSPNPSSPAAPALTE